MTFAGSAVAVILPCRNEVDYIENCLDSILGQTGLTSDSEIFVVDGMSTDGTRAIVQAWADRDNRIRLLDNPKLTVSFALNIAILVARSSVIVRIDAHTEYAPDYVEECLSVLKSTGAQNVGGPARTRANGYVQEAIQLAYHSSLVVGGAKFHDVNYEGYVDTVTYGCWRKSTLVDVGLFDEELVRNQDDELNLRIARTGGKIWQSPAIRSWYWPRSSLSKLFQQYMQYGYWKVTVIRKHRLPASVRHIVPALFVASVIALAVIAPFSKWTALVLFGLIALYIGFVILTSLAVCRQFKNWKYLPILPIVIPCFQISYGLGFLKNWFFRPRKGNGHLTSLSR